MKTKGKILGAIVIAFAIFLPLALGSCKNDEDAQHQILSALEWERDSLVNVASEQSTKLSNMTEFFDSVSACLDSIVLQEQLLLPVINPETNRRYSRNEIKERLNLLGEYISRQRERIRKLTDSLDYLSGKEGNMSIANTVTFLTAQLEEKEGRINELQRELNEKNRDIRTLTAGITSLKEELTEVKGQNETLATAVVAQTEIMNETYVLIGNKKMLQEAGALTKGGFLRKSNYDAGNIDLSRCQKVDIRQFTNIPTNSKNPKILSAVPNYSYHWAENPNGKTLVIDNVNLFWSLSNILVIQL